MENYSRVERTNAETGEISVEFRTQGTLKSMSNAVLSNSNGTNYRIATVEVPSPKGGTTVVSAQCFEGNYAHQDIEDGTVEPMTVGEKYLTTLSFGEDGQPWFQVSHLQGAGLASKEEFSAEAFGMVAETTTTEEAPAGAPVRA